MTRAWGVRCRVSWLLVAALLPASVRAQAPPNTDVWVAPLSRVGDSIVVGAPRNVTARPGYDNQPSFTLDSRAILYTAVVDGQADVFRYDLPSGRTTRLTDTPESEYSPTVTPDGRHVSVVRVERDSTQRLWKFPVAGGAPSLVLRDVKPVGYHAWVDDSTVALFVLGQPATLRLAHLGGGSVELLDEGIGRALLVTGGRAVAYVKRDSSGAVVHSRSLDPRLPSPVRIMALPGPRSEYFVPYEGRLLSTDGDRLLAADLRGSGPAPGPWRTIAGFLPDLLRQVTRLAVSPDGRWLAFVAEPAPVPVAKDR